MQITGVIKANTAGSGMRVSLGTADRLTFTFTISSPGGSAGPANLLVAPTDFANAAWTAYYGFANFPGTYTVARNPQGPYSATSAVSIVTAGSTSIAQQISAAGADVVLTGGKYLIGTVISIPSNKTVRAATGVDVTLFCNSGFADSVFQCVGASNVAIKNLSIDGNWAGRSAQEGSAIGCLLISGGSNIAVQNVRMTNNPMYGVWSYNCNNLSIKDNVFNENFQPIRIDGNSLLSTGTINNNLFYNTAAFRSLQHIDALGTKGLIITDNTFAGAGLLTATAHGFQGTWGNSIYISNSDNVLAENNSCSLNYWSSIVFGAGTTNSTMQRNNFADGVDTSACAWVEQVGADTVTIDRNIMDGGLSVGDSGGDHLTITNNRIMSRSVGMDVNQGAQHALIQHNIITSKSAGFENGIYLWEKSVASVSCAVKDNVIFGFNNGVSINNSGGVGNVFNVTVTGNYIASISSSIVAIPAALVLNGCTIQSATVAPVKPALTTSITAEDSTSTAFRLSSSDQLIPANSSGLMQLASSAGARLAIGASATVSVWARAFSGTLAISMGPNDYQLSAYTLTTAWQSFTFVTVINNDSDRIFEIFEQTASNNAWELSKPVLNAA